MGGAGSRNMLKANVSRNNQIWVKLNSALRPAVLTASGIEVQMVATCHFSLPLKQKVQANVALEGHTDPLCQFRGNDAAVEYWDGILRPIVRP